MNLCGWRGNCIFCYPRILSCNCLTCVCQSVCIPPKSFATLCLWQRRENTPNARCTYLSSTGGWKKRWRKAALCNITLPMCLFFPMWLSYRENNLIGKGLEYTVTTLKGCVQNGYLFCSRRQIRQQLWWKAMLILCRSPSTAVTWLRWQPRSSSNRC